jgi:ATP-dependent Lon protease
MLEFAIENGNEMAIAPYSKQSGLSSVSPIETTFGWGHIIQKEQLPDGRSNILLEGLGTAELIEYISTEPFRIAKVKKIDQDRTHSSDPKFKEMIEEMLILTKRILLAEGAEDSLIIKMNHIANHMYPVDFIASMLNYDYNKKQELLSTTDAMKKAKKLLEIVRTLNLRE